MKTIHKFRLKVEDEQLLTVPSRSHLMDIQVQRHIPCLWALVDDERPPTTIKLFTFGTGNPIPEDARLGYLGTYQLSNFVFHVFLDMTYE